MFLFLNRKIHPDLACQNSQTCRKFRPKSEKIILNCQFYVIQIYFN